MMLLILHTFHTDKIVCLVTDIRKNIVLIFFWVEFHAGFETQEVFVGN